MKERNENITEELTQEVEKLMQFVKILQVVKNKILKKNKNFEETISKELDTISSKNNFTNCINFSTSCVNSSVIFSFLSFIFLLNVLLRRQ